MLVMLTGCTVVGTRYQRPPAIVPTAFKETPPEGWKEAHPSDRVLKGKWWEVYNDPQLNDLEEMVSISNQNLQAIEANYRAARDVIRIARSNLFPQISGGASVSNTGVSTASSTGVGAGNASHIRNTITLPTADFSWTADVWGAVRRSIRASAENAQVTAANLENARLSYQAALAIDYFLLHGIDGDMALLERNVASYREYLTLTQNRFRGGVATGADVAQAETQLNTTIAQLTDLGVARAQYEHAIAILTGRPPSAVEISRRPLTNPPPAIPVALPSELLERRPDIAASERQMAAQNEQIGIAQAAFYPTISLGATVGLTGSSLANVFTWPARFWSVSPGISQVIFDAGRRRAILNQQGDLFDATVANYRQTCLTAFEQVEDALSALRILEVEQARTQEAVQAAERSLQISTAQYKAGVVAYLQVITAQTFALQNERSTVDILTRRLTQSVSLIEALGGGWDASQLPSTEGLVAGAAGK
jgi:NodT family efflux transporter outer membrane factor (OMF) lipoprotein